MKILKTKIAILAISFVSFLGIQSASAIEGMSIGVAYNVTAFMGKGKETSTSGAGTTQKVTEEDGAMQENVSSVFVEYAASDVVSLGIEMFAEDISTPTNTNIQGTSGVSGTKVNNNVKATFSNHTTLYANVNMPFNTYLKLGYHMVDVQTDEALGTGGAYPNVDTTGYTVGLGYQHTADNGIFARVEVAVSEYDNVSAANSNEADKVVSVSDMYGATAAIKVGKSF